MHSLGTINRDLNLHQIRPLSITEIIQKAEPISAETLSSLPARFEVLKNSVEALWKNGNQLLAKINLSQVRTPAENPYLIDPLIVNTCFQLMALKLTDKDRPLPPFTLKAIKSLKLIKSPEDEFWVYINNTSTNGEVSIDLMLLDNNENVLMQINDLRFKTIPMHEALANITYTINWTELPESYWQEKGRRLASRWLIFSDQSPRTEQLISWLNEKALNNLLLFPEKKIHSTMI